jgi:hypothetical protein
MTNLFPGEDFDWLKEVHEIDTDGYALATLYGNEDAPTRVELFKANHYLCEPIVVNF